MISVDGAALVFRMYRIKSGRLMPSSTSGRGSIFQADFSSHGGISRVNLCASLRISMVFDMETSSRLTVVRGVEYRRIDEGKSNSRKEMWGRFMGLWASHELLQKGFGPPSCS